MRFYQRNSGSVYPGRRKSPGNSRGYGRYSLAFHGHTIPRRSHSDPSPSPVSTSTVAAAGSSNIETVRTGPTSLAASSAFC